ncbi:hypothetical protein E1B28_001941 [Marasmius oreades]|uniref:C2H2-type domain-containing protein n=1 Tax=Marasmius oreades TaxID=181124 RepID=A0A9P7V4F6_9AGAR|nr:uncharacterized protein E1B28_001941 [Marasmius oreades]KAG7100161.1 hypothetical protein E1B28_001941 [Marasmius oreades]
MQPTQSILDLEVEDWRGSAAAVHPTAETASYFDEISFGNGAQHRSSPVDLPPMIPMSSPFINNSYQKQPQYNPGQHHMQIGTLHHHPNTHSHQQQQQYHPVPAHHHTHEHGQHHYDMDVDSVYHSSYSNSYGQQQQVHSPTLSPPLSSQHHIQDNLGQQQHEAAAVCDPRFVSGHHDFFSPLQQHTTITSGNAQHLSPTSSNQGSKPSSPANVDGQKPRVKLEGDAEDLVYPSNDSSFSPLPHPQPLTVVIPSSTNSLHDVRLSAKRKFSSASDTYQSELFDPGYSLTSAVRVEIDGRNGVGLPTALISPLERADMDLQDHEGDSEAYSDADGDSEECDYDYDDANDSEFDPRSRPSVARRISHQYMSTQTPQHSPEQAWFSMSSQPVGRRRAATNPSIALPQTHQPQPSYAWGYSHDATGSSFDSGFSSSGSGVVRSRPGATAGMEYTHRYDPYPTGGYTHTYDGHSTSFDSSTLYGDDLTYSTQPSYPPSLDLNLSSLRSRRASTSTSTTSTTTPNTPLTPLTPLSAAGGDLGVSQAGIHVHGYATRSGGVSHAYSPSTTSAYDSSPNGINRQMRSLSPSGMGAGSKRRSRPSTSLPVPVPVPNLTKKSRGRRVPTVYQPSSSNGSSNHKGSRIHMCKVPGCGKCFARGEHLKRHVRSIHTWEKPHKCPYPGCGKDFSRHDNLGQHMRVHKDFSPRV